MDASWNTTDPSRPPLFIYGDFMVRGGAPMDVEADREQETTDVELVEALEVLASPVRLALLRETRSPKTLKEITIRLPETGPQRKRPDSVLARQTVKQHLDRLVEVGIVVAREAKREYGATLEYVVSHQTLFLLSETFRSLARLRPSELPESVTIAHPGVLPPSAPPGPCLVLVKGLDEGRAFDLRPTDAKRQEWLVGRRRGIAVSLDFDPYVSTENARILWERGVHTVEDLPTSRNGTFHNFRPLPKGVPKALKHGDVVGVGRSLLLYRSSPSD
jgi:DNA-binding transcriptional ArsR family regulator